MSLVAGLAEMSGSPAKVRSHTAAKPALVFREIDAVTWAVLRPRLSICSLAMHSEQRSS